MAEPLDSNILFSITTLPGVETNIPLALQEPKKELRISTSGVHVRFSRASPIFKLSGAGAGNSISNSLISIIFKFFIILSTRYLL